MKLGADMPDAITPAMDRRNGILFLLSWQLQFLGAPVIFVGVVQAALCDKLGAGATIANLPMSAFLLGSLAPFFLAWRLPLRYEPTVIVVANAVSAITMAFVGAVLIFHCGNPTRIAFVVGQGFLSGILSSASGIYLFQCLGRGTSAPGRTKTLKWTFTSGPLFAVVGSLGAQFILNRGFHRIPYPYDFAVLYFFGVPCLGCVAWLSTKYQLISSREKPRQSFLDYIGNSTRAGNQRRTLALLWIGYFFWYCVLDAMPNISLYTKVAIGRDPKELSGAIMALRFGFKAIAGFGLGALALRRGARAPIIASAVLFIASLMWAWVVPGYLYLLSFGLMGAAELGAAYFLNYVIESSTPANTAQNLSLLQLAVPASSLAPVLYGMATESYGFHASFVLGIATALIGFWIVMMLPSKFLEMPQAVTLHQRRLSSTSPLN
jgi:MFS family permease